MKDWSVNCLELRKPKIFLDTNILSYLIDGTYPSLNGLLRRLGNTCLFDLVSSDYCKSEFVGIRKREHYLRLCVQKAQEGGKALNFSSLLKYHNQFGSEEIPFFTIVDEIRDKVKNELEKITTDYGIDFCCKLHDGLTSIANGICLCSKISKEDSLVMASSVIPIEGSIYDNVILLTHDQDFVKWYKEEPAKSNINMLFHENSLPVPYFIDTRDAFKQNLDNGVDPNKVFPEFVKWFVSRFEDLYIGNTLIPVQGCPEDSFALKGEINKPICQNAYIFFVGHDLDYMYAIPNRVDFYHKDASLNDGHIFTDGADNILCARMPYDEEIFESIELYNEILHVLREDGNYVFYLPLS